MACLSIHLPDIRIMEIGTFSDLGEVPNARRIWHRAG
jgi:hypothetical protein